MQKTVKIVIIAVVALVVLGVVKNTLAQTVITGAISKAAHVHVRIGSTNVGLLSSKIDIKNLKVQNPAGFPDRLMIDVPRIFIHMDVPGLFKGQAHFHEVVLDLKEMTVVKNKDGKLNVDAVKPTSEEKKESKEKAK